MQRDDTSNRANQSADIRATDLGLPSYQGCGCGIIRVLRNRPVPYAIDRLVDDEKGHQEPFAGDNRLAEAIPNFDIKPSWGTLRWSADQGADRTRAPSTSGCDGNGLN